MKIYDISIPLCDRTPVWEGDKPVRIGRTSTIGQGSEYNVSTLETGLHAGTHIDAPFHVLADGRTVDQIPLERLIGKTQVIHLPETIVSITRKTLADYPIPAGMRRVLFRTRYSRYWAEDPQVFHEDFVALDEGAARELVASGIQLVGIDGFSIATHDDMHSAHCLLLGAGIAVLENLDLHAVPAGVYDLVCLPLKLTGTDGAPVRAILIEADA